MIPWLYTVIEILFHGKCRCRKWVQNTRREDIRRKSTEKLNQSYRLCSVHFEDSQFMNPNEKRRLVWSAVPTLFDVPNPPPKQTLSRAPRKCRHSSDLTSPKGQAYMGDQSATSDQPSTGDQQSTSDCPSSSDPTSTSTDSGTLPNTSIYIRDGPIPHFCRYADTGLCRYR